MLRRALIISGALLLALLLWACTPVDQNEFAIYLLKERMTAGQAQQTPLDQLALGERILSTDDILSYSQATHAMELTPRAYARVRAIYKVPVETAGIPFVVCVGNQRIYAGAFWTPLSSLSFDGPFILQPFADNPQTIRIDLGYPGRAGVTATDPRSDPRIFASLAKAGKLTAGRSLQQLRIRNSGQVPIKSLVVVLPEDRIAYEDTAAGATTDYRDVPHGVLRYAVYEYLAEGKVVLQPVVDWIGEQPLEGEAFTYTLDLDPERAPALQIRLVSVERDK